MITLPSLHTEHTVIVPSGAMIVIGLHPAIALPVSNSITDNRVISVFILLIPLLWIVE